MALLQIARPLMWPSLASVLLLLVLFTSLAEAASLTPKASAVQWQPKKLVNGSPVLFQLSTSARVKNVSGVWLGHPLIFFQSAGSWYSLGGVPVETAPGAYDLKLTETLAGGRTAELNRKVKIAKGIYPSIAVKVSKQYTEPNPEQLHEINADKELKQKTFATNTPDRLWSGDFVAPVSASISDIFGTARVFNQQVQSRHLGLDYGVPAGTPVHAVNRGTVILARPLYFEGSCVVIDHGQGLFSLYLHLSEFRVKEGDQVDTGQLIGVSGGSGRATGPHLHLALRWQGVYLDPALLLKLHLP